MTPEQEARCAPVQGNPAGTMSWAEHLEVWEAYAKRYGHRQDAECIAQRGGFGKQEAEKLLGRPLTTWEKRK